MEADAASSKRDFVHKISICKKEARETQHWLRMMKVQNPTLEPDVAILQKEIQELVFIFSAIINSCRSSKSDDSPNP